jgi:hypothetical protein
VKTNRGGSAGERAIMRRISLVVACCSARSRLSRACAAIVCFSFAIDSAEDDARRFALVFFRDFLSITPKKKTRLAIPVRVYLMRDKTGIDQSANLFECLDYL